MRQPNGRPYAEGKIEFSAKPVNKNVNSESFVSSTASYLQYTYPVSVNTSNYFYSDFLYFIAALYIKVSVIIKAFVGLMMNKKIMY